MRKILSITLTSLLCLGCPEATLFQRTYILENNSGKDIEVFFFQNSDMLSLIDSRRIRNKSKLRGNEIENNGKPFEDLDLEVSHLSISKSFYGARKAIIVFGNEKKTEYQLIIDSTGIKPSEPIERNIFNHTNYQSIGNDQYLFKISQEDFQNATPCNGPCN